MAQTRRRITRRAPPLKKAAPKVQGKRGSRLQRRPCQCPGCPRAAAADSPLCATHTREGCPIVSPLSGYEPPYEPEFWNTDKAIQYSHNCFAYATNYVDWKKVEECRSTSGCNVGFHVPGKEKGHPRFGEKVKRQSNYMTCSDVVARTKASLRGVEVGFADACPPNDEQDWDRGR